jgi:hypothetical protein
VSNLFDLIMQRNPEDQHLRDVYRQVSWANLQREASIHLTREEYSVFQPRLFALRDRIIQENQERERQQVIFNGIKAHQANQQVHPLTCGNDSNHILIPYIENHVCILKCPKCDYVQTLIPGIF